MTPKHFFFFLFFLATTPYYIYGQEISLEIKAKTPKNDSVINSINHHEKHQDFASLKKESDSIIHILNHKGYLEARLLDIQKINDSSFISHFELGQPTDTIYIHINNSDRDLEPLTPFIKPEHNIINISFVNLNNTLNNILSYLEKKGDAFAKVSLNKFYVKDKQLNCHLTVHRTLQRKINKIIIRGYEQFPMSFLRHGTRIKKNMTFSKESLGHESEKLESLNFIEITKSPEVLFTKDSTEVYLYLKRKKANSFEGFLGFSNTEKNSNLTLNGFFNVSLSNNLHLGEQLYVEWKNNGNGQNLLHTEFDIPYLFKTPLGIKSSLNITKQDTLFSSTTLNIKASFKPSFFSEINLGLKSLTSDNLIQTSTSNDTIANMISKFVGLDYMFLKNSPTGILGIKTKIRSSIQTGKRTQGDIKTNQQYFLLSGSHQLKLSNRNHIFIQNTFEVLFSNNYFSNEKFRFGGLNSLRGFKENQLEATSYNITQLEYRYLISNSLLIHSISDLGFLNDKLSNTKKTLLGVGFGIRLNSKSGNFTMNIATGKNDDSSLKFKNILLHLGYIANF